MIQAHISIDNLDEGFQTSMNEVLDAIDGNGKEIAEFVTAEAQHTSAFIDRTGNLRKSIRMRKSKFENGGYIVMASGGIGRGKGYHAHLVEFGHNQVPPGNLKGGRVAARPFMRPALDKGIRVAVELFRSKK